MRVLLRVWVAGLARLLAVGERLLRRSYDLLVDLEAVTETPDDTSLPVKGVA